MTTGPLVIFEHISADTNLFIAFVIGLAFGFILESAGFSSSRRLAGVFYGYDMLVLKVFFSAAITAMVGLLIFSLLGWIDLSLIFVNPLFTGPTIVGGLIMGLGFILGGFCPGTSFCAAAIGKIDAWWFILGIFIGIFVFMEAYPLYADFFTANPKGALKLSDLLGLNDGVLALIIVVIALAAFWFSEWIEKRVNYK